MQVTLTLLAAIPGGLGLVLLIWSRWSVNTPLGAVVQRSAGAVLVGLAVGVLVTWGWATTSTDTSQFARALIWGERDVGDVDRFPTRTVRAGPNPRGFNPAEASSVEAIDRFSNADVDAARIEADEDQPINGFDDFLEASGTTSFIVIRGDDRLYEGYFAETGPATVHTSFAMANSVVSALIGVAVGEGRLTLNDPVTDYLPALAARDSRFAMINIRHLLTMSSGLAFDDGPLPWSDRAATYYSTDIRKAALETTQIEQPPGLEFEFNDWNTVLLGLVVEEVGRSSVSEFLQIRIWLPMGAFTDATWSLDSTSAGFERSFVGINATAMDFARFGVLHRDRGFVNGVAVLPATYVEEATRADTETDPTARYQYHWWIDVARDSFYSQGDHCQYIYVSPATDTVIVRTGTTCAGVDWPALFGELAESVIETPS